MTHTAWAAATSISPADLTDTSLQLHWAAQYLAAAGQTFCAPAHDDSHRAMAWDARARAFVGTPFAGAYPFRTALRPEDLTLLLLDRTGAELGALPLIGKAREEGFEWLRLGMATYLGEAPRAVARPEYELPHHPVAADQVFSGGRMSELGVLSSLYGAAATVLEDLVASRTDASDVRCWPHHFDIATLITLNSSAEDGPRTVGVGLAPMGGGYDHWYWYVSPRPYPPSADLPALSGGATWHTDGWTGAVLTGEVVSAVGQERRPQAVRDFLSESVHAATTLLGMHT